MKKNLTSLLKVLCAASTITGLGCLATGSFKQESGSEEFSVAYDTLAAHSVIGEDVIDVDKDGKADYIVDSPYQNDPVCIVAFKKGYQEKAEEFGYILKMGAKQMDSITEQKAQKLFAASEEYRKLRGR